MRLTAVGTVAAALSPTILVAAYLLGYAGLAVLGTGGLAAFALALITTARRPAVEISREIFPTRVTRGELAVGLLTARNTSRSAGVLIDATERFGADEIQIPVPYLPSGASREVGYQLPTQKRDVITVGPLRWEHLDALGLVRRSQTLIGGQQLYVYPIAHQFPLASLLRAERWDSSSADAALKGTITFHMLREYVPGDDLRYIHWRSSARHDTLMVRHNIDPSIPMTTVLLVTGLAAYGEPEWFEEAVEVAASVVVAACHDRLPVRLWTTAGEMLRGDAGHDDARTFLDFLAGVAADDSDSLGPTANRMEHAERGGLLIVATGSLSGDDLAVLRRTAARFDNTVVALLGPSAGPERAEPTTPLSIVTAASAAQFCARWAGQPRRWDG